MSSPLDKAIAVLVLYSKTLDQSAALRSLLKCMEGTGRHLDVLVYDNRPHPFDRAMNPSKNVNILYVHDPSNPGVSKAYNTGFQMAKRLGKEWLLLLDEDTELPCDAIEKYSVAISANKGSHLFAPMLVCNGRLYSPCGYVSHKGFRLKHVQPGVSSIRGKSLFNSGICISVDAFEKAGCFNEEIPVDFSDHDFIRRYKKRFGTFVLVDLTCNHGFSDTECSDLQSALSRFGYYCKGARNSVASASDAFSLFTIASLRAIRLAARFRSLQFFQTLLCAFLGNASPAPPAPDPAHPLRHN